MQPTNPQLQNSNFASKLANFYAMLRQTQFVPPSLSSMISINNRLWQGIISRDFYTMVRSQLHREEPKSPLLLREIVTTKGPHIGTFFTPGKNEFHFFPSLCSDPMSRVFVKGTDFLPSSELCDSEPTKKSSHPSLPEGFIESKGNYFLVWSKTGSYQFLDREMIPIAAITPINGVVTFEVLKEGFLTIGRCGEIQLWDFKGNLLKDVFRLNALALDLFSVLLPTGESAILARHMGLKGNYTQDDWDNHQSQVLSLIKLDGTCLDKTSLEKLDIRLAKLHTQLAELNNRRVLKVKRIDEYRFTIVLGGNYRFSETLQDAFILSTSGDTLPLIQNASIQDIAVDSGKIYILKEKDSQRFVEIWGSEGKYLDTIAFQADKIDVFNGKIYSRSANDNSVQVYDLSVLLEEKNNSVP